MYKKVCVKKKIDSENMYFFYLALCPKTVNGRVTVTHSKIKFFWISLESTACEKYFFQNIFMFWLKTDEIGAFKVGKNKPSKRVKNLWPPIFRGFKIQNGPKNFVYIYKTDPKESSHQFSAKSKRVVPFIGRFDLESTISWN